LSHSASPGRGPMVCSPQSHQEDSALELSGKSTILCQKIVDVKFSSSEQEVFTNMCWDIQPTKIVKNEIIQSIFFDYNGTKLDINDKNASGKATHIWKLAHV
jgi:hypothetical protein